MHDPYVAKSLHVYILHYLLKLSYTSATFAMLLLQRLTKGNTANSFKYQLRWGWITCLMVKITLKFMVWLIDLYPLLTCLRIVSFVIMSQVPPIYSTFGFPNLTSGHHSVSKILAHSVGKSCCGSGKSQQGNFLVSFRHCKKKILNAEIRCCGTQL